MGVRLEDWELDGKVVAGIDTHQDTNWLCVLDPQHRVTLSKEFKTGKEGYEALADAIGDPACCAAVGVEGTCSYGAGITDVLVERGFRVLEVLRPKRETDRLPGEGKDDAIDAERAARDVISGRGTSVPKKRGGWVDGLRAIVVARDNCVKSKAAMKLAAKSLIITAPDEVRKSWEALKGDKMMVAMLEIEEDGASDLDQALLAIARSWETCSCEADRLERRMEELIAQNCPSILEVYCCGTVNAAALIVSAGENPERFGSDAKFAKHCGASPIPASSGKQKGKMRLNRGGDRSANSALHQIAVARLAHDERAKEYVKKKTEDPRTTEKDAIRCLRRYIARDVYKALTHPFATPQKQKRQELREARLMAGYTQKQVAEILGLSPSTISGVESGRVKRSKAGAAYAKWVEDGMPVDVENSTANVDKPEGEKGKKDQISA